MEHAFIDSVLAIFQSFTDYMFVFLAKMLPKLIEPAFIATFLFFTLVIWIGMSGDDREPVSSFSKAGFIAFIATVFMFAMTTN